VTMPDIADRNAGDEIQILMAFRIKHLNPFCPYNLEQQRLRTGLSEVVEENLAVGEHAAKLQDYGWGGNRNTDSQRTPNRTVITDGGRQLACKLSFLPNLYP